MPAAALPGKAWATPGLLSPALCSAGGGEGRPRESVGDAAWGSGEEEEEEQEEEKEKERSRGVLQQDKHLFPSCCSAGGQR